MGVVGLVGPKNALGFFLKEKKVKGSIFFFLGLLFIISGWYMFTFLGFISQLYGIFLLFRSFLGTILIYGQGLPFIGGFLRSQSANIQKAANKFSGGSSSGRAKFEV
jgi:hypothetical protein